VIRKNEKKRTWKHRGECVKGGVKTVGKLQKGCWIAKKARWLLMHTRGKIRQKYERDGPLEGGGGC